MQLSLTPASFYDADGWDAIYKQAFTGRFGFDNVRISHVQTVRQKQSNVNAPWDVYIALTTPSKSVELGKYIISIGVGLSTLLVSTNRAMREPLHCGTSNRTGSTFCVYMDENIKMAERTVGVAVFENRELCDLKNGLFLIWTILKEKL